MKKRMISLLLCVVMLIGLLPTSALAVTIIGENDTPLNESAKQCWTDKDGFSYYYFAFQEEAEDPESRYAVLSSVAAPENSSVTALTMPEALPLSGSDPTPIPLRVIDDLSRTWPETLTGVTLPSQLKTIGNRAFYYCGLTSVVIPDGVQTIGAQAFYQCALTSVEIPDSVQTIGTQAFFDQGHTVWVGWNTEWEDTLTSLTLGSGVQAIGEEAFGRNTKLNLNGTLALPNNLTSIGKNAFVECGFSSITWPNNSDFKEIKGFSYCTNLTDDVLKNLPDSVDSIGYEAFTGCTGITELTIPNFVQTIGEQAFKNCTALADLTIRDGVLTIGYDAFAGCTGLLGKSIEIPASVRTIYSGAFAGIYDENDPGAKALTVSLLNPTVEFPSGTTGEFGDDYRYGYFEAEDTSHSDKKSAADPFAQCAKLVLRAPKGSAAQSYAGAKDGTVFKLGMNLDFWSRSVTFQEIGASTDPVCHTVTTQAADGVTFTVKQDGVTLGSGTVVTVQALAGKDMVVTAHKEGYYDQVLVKRGADFTADWTVELGAWTALPVSDSLLVNITRDGLPLGSFDWLTLTLKNGDSEVEGCAKSYPYLVLPKDHGLDTSANLTLTVTPDPSMQLSGGTATLQNGSFTVALKSWGKAAITATSTTYAPCVVILFDGAGNAVSSGITSGGVFTSDPLPAGDYKAVAYETNDYFGAVGSMDALSALGLTSGDYAEGSVTITNGNTDKLTLTVPKLNTENLTSVLDTGKCSVVFRSNQAVTGVTFNMQVNYGLNTNTAEEKKITFTLPDGAEIQHVYDEEKEVTDRQANSVTVTNSSGTLYVSMVCNSTGSKSFGASITTGGKTLPLGSGTITVQDIFLNAVERYTAKRDGNRMEVYTKPNTLVRVTVPGGEITNTEPLVTNAAGRLALTYRLPQNAAYGQSFTLTAAANGGSDKTSITYFPASAELKQLGFHQCGSDITVIDNDHPDKEAKYYTYYAFGDEASKYFSLYATFKADQLLDVTVIVTMQDGSVRSVPMSWIKTEGEGELQTYAGELYLPGNSDDHVFHADSIPVGFEIDWEEPVAPKPDGNELYNQAMAKATQRQQARESAWETFLREEELTQVEEDTMNIFFNDGYRITNTDNFKDSLLTKKKYDELIAMIPEGASKQAQIDSITEIYNFDAQYLAGAYAAEAAMDEAADALTKALKLKKPIQQYSGWNDVLRDMGMEYSEGNSYNTDDLAAQGYTQMGELWYKKDKDGKITAIWPDGLNTQTGPAAAALLLEETPSASLYVTPETGGGLRISWDSTKTSFDNNWLETSCTAAGHAAKAAGKELEAQSKATMEFVAQKRANFDEVHPDVPENAQLREDLKNNLAQKEKCATKQAKAAVCAKGVSYGFSLANLVMDINQLTENTVTTAKSEAKASELEPLIQYYKMHGDTSGCVTALEAEAAAYRVLNNFLTGKSALLWTNIGMNVVATLADAFTLGTGGRVFLVYDISSAVAMAGIDMEIAEYQKVVDILSARRQSICGDWRKMPKRTITPILDPSGIVYEAVESNVLSGVTATIYEVSGSETQWVAEPFNQRNPLTTGTDGGYAWDVPPGKWQVKFTKPGYEDTATAKLDVPPPQMNLKTPMFSEALPTVVSAAAYPDYVELVFSQYMSVKDEDKPTASGYTCKWVYKEKVNAESNTEYSKVLRLIPEAKAAVGATVAVTLSGAKNYAGKELAAYSSGPLTVAVEPAQLRLNYDSQIAVPVGASRDPRVTVQVLDRNGQPIPGLTVTAAIKDTAYATVATVQGTTDASGVAVFDLKGQLPGWTKATFSVKDSSLTKTMPVRVTIDSNQVAKPVASIGGNVYTGSTNSITVPRGSALTLTCATEGAVIYYTTNDTCPCQAMDRHLYTGPITVNEDTYVRIAAYKDGMEYSERLNLRVRVSESSPGGGSGSGYTPGYSATAEQSANGSVSISPKSASKGDTVTVTVTPDKGYTLETLTVTDKDGNELKLTEKNGKYTFTMPASKVTVNATFMEDNSMLNFFVDVPADAYYYDAVLWAAENGITSGTTDTTFSPDAPCTRAQIVTFLWRAAGSPEPKGAQSFSDVTAGSYYEKAVAWAAENGITGGTGDGKFSPGATCTRAQAVTFLYRAGDAPAVSSGATFTDVAPGAYYADAVAWAAENTITGGIGGGLFAPGNNCTRAQIVTFLYRSVK